MRYRVSFGYQILLGRSSKNEQQSAVATTTNNNSNNSSSSNNNSNELSRVSSCTDHRVEMLQLLSGRQRRFLFLQRILLLRFYAIIARTVKNNLWWKKSARLLRRIFWCEEWGEVEMPEITREAESQRKQRLGTEAKPIGLKKNLKPNQVDWFSDWFLKNVLTQTKF